MRKPRRKIDAQIYAREGVDLDRATMADLKSARRPGCCARSSTLIAAHVMAAEKLHADDTPVPVLDPGRGRSRTGQLWVYLRDDRPCAGAAPPAVLYRYSPDRKGEHPQAHLGSFRGLLQADGGACPRAGLRPDPWAGFDDLYEVKKAGRPPSSRWRGGRTSAASSTTSIRPPAPRWPRT